MATSPSTRLLVASKSVDDTVATEFHLFGALPIELRRSIWEHAFDEAFQSRLVTLCDPFIPESLDTTEKPPLRTGLIFDERAPFFHACVESRSLLLAKSRRFVAPKASYHFINPDESSVEAFLTKQGHRRREHLGSARILEATLEYYNARPEEAAKHPTIFKLGPPLPRLQSTIWFDRENDFLLVPFSRVPESYHSTLPEWNYCGTLAAQSVKKLAIEMSRADWDHWTHVSHAVFPNKVWSRSLVSGGVEWDRLQSVQEIALWTREGCEVCWFTVDTQGLLEPDEWAFSLDTQNRFFEKRLRDRWSNVTWRIMFGKSVVSEDGKEDRPKNVCEMLRDWQPHSSKWWSCKQNMVQKVPSNELGQAWKGLVERSITGAPLNADDMIPVPGTTNLYYGPSFDI